tara:strand:+ start:149 stop:451 length:303 start_codon:yes stop_codon:yes gene_type:complete
MSSSKFSSPFFQKSPLLGAYTSGADAVFAPSDAEHFKDLSNKITGGTLAAIGGLADKEKDKKFAKWVASPEGKGKGSDTDEYRAEYTRIYGAQAPRKPRN